MSATTVPFSPRPGSLGQRAIEHLTIHGRTGFDKLVDALDSDVPALKIALTLCERHGLVEHFDGRVFGEYGIPAILDEKLPNRLKSEHGPVDPAGETFPWPFEAIVAKSMDHMSLDGKGSEEPRAEWQPPPPAARHFEFGLFSDGRLVIEVDATVATLTRDETERLFKFVQGIEGALHAAE